ncbi:hypothetical protein [Hymenobacter sp. YC55]|uniref:hypothetical protein n=1 Tax=Hymenobacter sp. YC55 TaxID=3034019 RepID=UPI0023F95B15|nr:hypothetical protein [Hymenobacter sp. YC55]MDF7809908.1 hypothetical protein [Hymenobacter sp. YC55]
MFSLKDSLKIEIGALQPIDFVHELKIVSTWQRFTDTCTITLPRKIRVLQAGAVKDLPDLLSVGDAVNISYGYDGVIRPEFSGFISAIKPGTPFQIECEDQMWQLKRKPLSKAWRAVTLRQLLQYVLDENGLSYPIQELGELALGKYTITKATGAQVFDSLKTQFGIRCFFRGGVLVAGNPYPAAGKAVEHRYGFTQNIISSDLTYTLADDVAIRFHGISHLKGGKKIEIDEGGSTKTGKVKGETGQVVNAFSKGVPAGEIRTINAVGLTETELRAYVKAEAARLRFDGYRGGFTTFGNPPAEHGDVAVLSDPDYPERAGAYSIDEVVKTFGVGGSRRQIKLGPKAAL